MAARIPMVDYLALEPEPHLVAQECEACGARFFDRRNACASCSATAFEPVRIATEGEVRTFTIVAFAAPGVAVPFVAAIVDCDGTTVQGNLVNVAPDPEHVTLGMPVRLTTFPLGVDSTGVEAIGFGFEPAGHGPGDEDGDGQDQDQDRQDNGPGDQDQAADGQGEA